MIAVNVAQLLRSQVGTFRSYDFSEQVPDLAAEVNVCGPVEGRVKLTRTPRGIVADVDYAATVEQECGRCLEPVRTALASQVSDEYLATTNVYTGQPEAVVVEPEELTINPNHELDLTDLIRQDLLIQQPLQPLCREECAGLCPTCGADLNGVDLNQDDHGHADDAVADVVDAEPPLGRLGELLRQKLSPNAEARG